MKNLFAMTAAVAMSFAGIATAQTTTQTAVLGTSDNANYPVQIAGANGETYNCMADIVVVDGVQARRCVNANAGGSLFEAGNGLGAGAAAAAGALLVIAVAANDSSSTTTSTNN